MIPDLPARQAGLKPYPAMKDSGFERPLRSLEEIRADLLALEQETEGLLGEIIGEGA